MKISFGMKLRAWGIYLLGVTYTVKKIHWKKTTNGVQQKLPTHVVEDFRIKFFTTKNGHK